MKEFYKINRIQWLVQAPVKYKPSQNWFLVKAGKEYNNIYHTFKEYIRELNGRGRMLTNDLTASFAILSQKFNNLYWYISHFF